MAQDLHHSPLGALFIRTVIRNLHHHFVAGHGTFRAFLRHENILRQFGVVRYYKAVVLSGTVIGAHYLCDSPGNNPYYLCLLALTFLFRKQRHFHRIPVESSVYLLLRYIQILFSAFNLHKAEAPGIADKCPCQHMSVGFHIFSFCGKHQLSFRQKLPQNLTQFLSIFPGHLKECRQFLLLHGNIDWVSHQIADYFFPGL